MQLPCGMSLWGLLPRTEYILKWGWHVSGTLLLLGGLLCGRAPQLPDIESQTLNLRVCGENIHEIPSCGIV